MQCCGQIVKYFTHEHSQQPISWALFAIEKTIFSAKHTNNDAR